MPSKPKLRGYWGGAESKKAARLPHKKKISCKSHSPAGVCIFLFRPTNSVGQHGGYSDHTTFRSLVEASSGPRTRSVFQSAYRSTGKSWRLSAADQDRARSRRLVGIRNHCLARIKTVGVTQCLRSIGPTSAGLPRWDSHRRRSRRWSARVRSGRQPPRSRHPPPYWPVRRTGGICPVVCGAWQWSRMSRYSRSGWLKNAPLLVRRSVSC
jgi:hypothetical protein